ncbi:MAG TPA: hypothetical protein VHR18_00080 [Solirubrobacterales bacterium]|nr:hypothetical protein [Solirubrobacterales bacterium]
MEEPREPDIIVRRKPRPKLGEIRWARSATKHRISRERSIHVIERSELWFEQAATPGPDPRFVILGTDDDGVALELPEGSILIIHAMPMRSRYKNFLRGVKK